MRSHLRWGQHLWSLKVFIKRVVKKVRLGKIHFDWAWEKPVFRFRLTAPFLGTAGNHIISNCLGKNLLKPLHVWSNDYLKTGLVCVGRLIDSTVVVNLRSVSPLPEYLRLRSVKQPRVLQPPTPPWTVYLSSVGLSPSPLIISLEFPNSTSYHWFPFW